MSSFTHTTYVPPDPSPSPPYVTDESEDDESITVVMDNKEDPFSNSSSSNSNHHHPVVTFASCCHVIEIPSRESFSVDEIHAAWYKKEDYQAMKRGALQTIQLQRAGQLLPGNPDHCMRGLEGRTNDGYNIVKNNRSQASYAVIDEQDRQDEVGINDPDLLSEVYQRSSLQCKCVAFAQGLFDAQEVIKDILSETSSMSSSSSSQADSPSHGLLDPRQLFSLPSLSQVPNASMLLRLLVNVAQDEQQPVQAMVVESNLQISVQKDVEEMPLDSMEWTAAEA